MASGLVDMAKHFPGNNFTEPFGPDLLHLLTAQIKDIRLGEQLVIPVLKFSENNTLHSGVKTRILGFFKNTVS
jgi:hypothetical protein